MMDAKNKGTIEGLEIKNGKADLNCDVCHRGKMVQTSFPKKSERKTDILDIIHTDLCGPMKTESHAKSKYFMTLIDDSSRWCEVRFLKSKSEAFRYFKEYVNYVENQKERKVKCLQSDNGGEFINHEFENFLKMRGIARRLTVPRTPEQNGVAERKNRSLIETARCLLIQSGLSSSFWAEAVNSANYIRNRCPTKKLNGMTPFEAWTSRKPSVSHFREFGCPVYCMDKEQKGKFDERSRRGTFVGYSEETKGFRVWLPKQRRVEIVRDVKFMENSSYENRKETEILNDPFQEFIVEDFQIQNEPRFVEIEMETASKNTEHEQRSEREQRREEETIEIQEAETNIEEEPLQEIEEITVQEPQENTNTEVIREDNNIEDSNKTRRGPGRPRKSKTGLRGRPRKIFNEIKETVINEDEESEQLFLSDISLKKAMNSPETEE